VSIESWLPIGFELPDGARCGRPLHAEANWQIVETRGRRLRARRQDGFGRQVGRRRPDRGRGEFREFSFGSETTGRFPAGQANCSRRFPTAARRSNKNEALAFAMADETTRDIDPDSPLQDALYVEKFSRLLPSYGITSRTDDDIVLGYWLTGGARRLGQVVPPACGKC
jgi:cell division protease FtsH